MEYPKLYKNYRLFLIYMILLSTFISAQDFRIILDEDYTDWDTITPLYSDASGDGSGIDFKTLKTTNYNKYLFFLLEMDTEINLQDQNAITLYLDTDNDNSTGLAIKGIGAELEYTFGARSGIFRNGSSNKTISQANIGLVSIPTVTSNIFEIMIDTTVVINGDKLFTNSQIKIVLVDNTTGGDEIPNEEGGLDFFFETSQAQRSVDYSIEKLDEDQLRIISYNSQTDNLFEPSLKESNSRILKAINPDIIGLQEINNHSSEQTAELIEEFLPSSINEQWFSSKQGSDIVVISRYPISQSFYVEGNGAFLIDLSKNYEQDLLLINAHPPCCAKNDERQKEIDAFMAFIRDAKEEGGALTLKENTPIVILGDMNLVGYNQQQKTLITGDIVNTNDYGDKFIPDWDTTSLMDTKPPTTHSPSTFTWYNKRSDFAPGRLDYIVYTNSVIEHQNGFVLFTNELPQDSLDKYNLLYDDATRASDHLPVVADFNFGPIVSVNQVDNEKPNNFVLLQNYPNPFNPSTTIKYKIPSVERDLSRSNKSELKFALQNVSLKIYDILGREVAILVNKQQLPGNYEVKFDGRNLASGVYYYQLKTDSFIQSRKMILMK